MAVQARVSARRMQAHVGRELDVLVEREEGRCWSAGPPPRRPTSTG
jgi:hypothetical protein